MKIVPSILALLLLSGCEPKVVNLDRVVPDPGFPPVLVQVQGCHNQNGFETALSCSLPKPASAQDPVLTVYWVDTGSASVADDVNDVFAVFAPSASKPGTGAAIYTYSTITQGATTITITPASSNATVADAAVLELSGGAFSGSASNPVYISSPCGAGWSCEYGSPSQWESGTIPISKFSILVGAQLGIYSACKYEFDPYGPGDPQMYNDINSPCKGWGAGFTVVYGRGGSQNTFCGNDCGFTVEIATTSSPVAAPFLTYNPPSESAGTSWVAEEMAIQ